MATSLEIAMTEMVSPPKPFIKWAGGKTQLLTQLTRLLPAHFAGFHEPFVGSAALYFHLCGLRQKGQLGSELKSICLTDSNEELVNCYQVVRDYPSALLARLAMHRQLHSSDYYYSIRAL